MRPIRTPRSNTVYVLDRDNPDTNLPGERVITAWQVKGLGPVAGPGMYAVPGIDQMREAEPKASAIRSAWQLTDDELAYIAMTGLLELTIYGEPIPPVSVSVINPGDWTDYGYGPESGHHPEPPLSREHANLALGALYARLLEHIDQHAGVPDADQWLQHWHDALAETSAGAGDPHDPDARPAENPTDPRTQG